MIHDPVFLAFRLIDRACLQGLYHSVTDEELSNAFDEIKHRENTQFDHVITKAIKKDFIKLDVQGCWIVQFQTLYRYRAKITERMIKKTTAHKN